MPETVRPTSPTEPAEPMRAAAGGADRADPPLDVWEPADLAQDSGEPSIRTLRLGPGTQARPPGTLPGVVLEREIGRGRSGVVWRARLTLPSGLERRVAVRMLPGEGGGDPGFLARLREEVAVYARLRHRAVARVEAVLELDGGPALLAEYIDGVGLAERMRAGVIPARAVAELLAELASALEAAHAGVSDRAGGVVTLTHGELRPSSVRVTRWGEVMLLDLGTASALRAARGEPHRSGSGWSEAARSDLPPDAERGAGYLAPEVMAGAPVSASDLYALGVLAWECRTGERLAAMSSQRTVHAEQSSRALGRLDGRGWRPLVAALLAWDPAARPSAREARLRFDALAHVCEGPSLREWADVPPGARDLDLTSPGDETDSCLDIETGSVSLSLNELTNEAESAVTDRLVGEPVDVERTETLARGFVFTIGGVSMREVPPGPSAMGANPHVVSPAPAAPLAEVPGDVQEAAETPERTESLDTPEALESTESGAPRLPSLMASPVRPSEAEANGDDAGARVGGTPTLAPVESPPVTPRIPPPVSLSAPPVSPPVASGLVERPRPITVPAAAPPAAPTPAPPLPPARVTVVPMPARSLTSTAAVSPSGVPHRVDRSAPVPPPDPAERPPDPAAAPPPAAPPLLVPLPSIRPASPERLPKALVPPARVSPPRPEASAPPDQPAWLSLGVAFAALGGAVVLLLLVIIYFIVLPNTQVH